MTVERYGNAVELRAEGRQISGVVVQYGETADPSRAMRQQARGARRERFAPRSYVASVPAVPLNIEHRALQAAAWYPGGGLTLIDDAEALRFKADLPEIPAGDMALNGVRSGLYKGVSVEFRALAESMQARERVIEQYELHGIGLTERPVYAGSIVEARQIETAAIRGTIQADGGRIYDCDCVGGRGSAVCKVSFSVGSFDKTLERVDAAKETSQRQPARPMLPPDVLDLLPPALPQVEAQNVVAHIGSFDPSRVLGDTNSGALFLALFGNILNIGLEPSALETEAGRALVQALETTDLHARPLIDFDRSEFTDEGEVRTYFDVWLQSILFKTALRSGGWLPITKAAGGDPGAAFGNLLPTADTLFL